MIFYQPDGIPFPNLPQSKPRHFFLITRLGDPVPADAIKIRKSIEKLCHSQNYEVIDANAEVTGGDYFNKIWELIVSSPVAIGICHEEFPISTQMNIYYELGIARAMGKEIIIVKSNKAEYPSDLVRDEYIEFNKKFKDNFLKYFNRLNKRAEFYKTMANFLEKDPLLAIDYLKRSFLITGDEQLRQKAKELVNTSGLEDRAKNSVEMLAASF